MDKLDTLNRLEELGLIAVLRGPSADLTVRMVEALVEGGVLAIEITYTTPDALDVVRRLHARYGEGIVLGMGTLVEPSQAAAAQEAGAMFLVSPHTDAELGAAMKATGLPLMMGALTPTEIMQSVKFGSDVVKLFPGSLGGPEYLKALKAPFPDIPMMPTGGVSKDNIGDWFKAGAVAVGAGSQLCPPQLAQAGKFDEISAIAQDFINTVRQVRR